ncbi:MAG: C25 family cysteine peptidase [Ignavibacteriaceae bacterium]
MRKKLVLSFVLLLLPCKLFGQITSSVNFDSEDLTITEITSPNNVVYSKIEFKDLESDQEVGQPEIPSRYINLIIPSSQRVKDISLTLSREISYNLSHLIYPMQPKIPTSIHYQPDEFVESYYDINKTYPNEMATIVHDGYFDGNNHIITIVISPIKYNPKSNVLLFYQSIDINLIMESTTAPNLVIRDRKASNQNLYDKVLTSMVNNPEAINLYQVKPTISLNPETLNCYEYVIVTTNALKNSFNKFIEWKKRKGLDVGVVTVEDILSSFSGDLISGIYDDAGKIRQFLYESYLGGTVWALLAGDYTVVPIRYGCGYKNYWTYPYFQPPTPDDYKIPADLYFADFNGDWELDGDEYTGEIHAQDGDHPDYNPEIFVGRLLCTTNQEILNWTEKIIKYEQDPGRGNTVYLSRAFMFESDHMQNGNEAEGVASYLPSFNTEIWRELPTYNDPNPYFPTGEEVIDEMNDTRYGLWGWFGHGEVPRVNTKTSGNNLGNRYQISSLDEIYTDPYQPNNGLDNMNNKEHLAMVYSISCDITPFDDYNPHGWWNDWDKNMGEVFTVVTNVGGPSLLGNTRYGWVGSSSYLFRNFATQIENDITHLGVAELISKKNYGSHYLNYSHNLIGCPETEIWVGTPNQFSNPTVSDYGTYIIVNTGTSNCIINVRSVNNGLSYSYTAEDVSSYTFNTALRPLIVTISKSQYLPFTAITGGTLTTDATLWGKLKVLNTITVASGRTLTIEPNTILSFANNSSLVVNGVLNAIGTVTDRITLKSYLGTTHSSWGTLTFSGSGAAGSQIKYADIKYGTKVEAINTSNITIQYCNIDTTYDGIRFNNSTGFILNNTITTNSLGHGIVAENAAYITVKENTITKSSSSRSGVGIYYGGGSNGQAACNDISNWDWGICAIWGSSPSSYSANVLQKNNRVRNCNTGLMVYRLSYPWFGLPSSYEHYSLNSISNNIYNARIGTSYPEYESRLYAYNNWWGNNPPNNSLFQIGSASYLYYNPYLTSDPWVVPSNTVSGKESDNLKKESISESLFDDFELIKGIRLLAQNKIREAKDHFILYISKNPTKRIGYVLLYYCYNDETAPELISYFKSLPGSLSKDFKLLLSQLYLKHNSSNLAKENNNTIIAENPNTSLESRAKLNNVYIALYNENNINEAINIFNEVMNKPELSTPLELQMVYDAITSYSTTYGQEAKNLAYLSLYEPTNEPELNKEGSLSQTVDLPTEYSLYSNYPNPFNPFTTIQFELNQRQFITLKIYDILGTEVATLVNEDKLAGKHKVEFDAAKHRLSSGVYLCELKSKGGNSSRIKLVFIK